MAEKTLHAVYDDDDKLLAAVKKIREADIDIEEVYTPFPVHGLDKVMGLKETRLAITAFIYGCIGFSSNSSVSAISTILPLNITAIRSHIYLATARS